MSNAALPALIEALRRQARGLHEASLKGTPANPQGSNPAELSAAHALAAMGETAVAPLIGELNHADWRVRAAAADVLGNMGKVAQSAAPSLTNSLQDDTVWVRRNAAEALGNIAPSDENCIAHLATALQDEDERVRRNSALALAKIGPLAAAATAQLTQVLADENRYVRYNAELALQRIDTPEARDALWTALQTARWCPLSTKETPY